MSLHNVARLADLREDRGTQVEIGDTKVVLLRTGRQVRAFQAECPHAGAPLAEGAVCNGHLTCPWHKAEFAIDDGHLCEPPALDDLQRYATEVRGDAVYVDDQPQERKPTRLDGDKRVFVIVGAGAAGTAAAGMLRDQGFGGRVVLIDQEREAGYDRTALSKFVLAGDMKPSEVPALREDQYYQDQHIERLNARVTRLDAVDKCVVFADGKTLPYDAALLATGGQPHGLGLPGEELENILLLRSRTDAQKILAASKSDARAVIIGDSFIGLESASALRELGLQVTVLAHHAIPFRKQFGPSVGWALRRLHEQHGVVFRTDAEASAFVGDGKVEGVKLDNGEIIPADLVLIGAGVKPATGLVTGLSLEPDGSMKVDAQMQAAPGLWAAGDIARFPLADNLMDGSPVRIEHWRLAQQQARIAALNMLGGSERYADVPYFWTYHYGKRFDYLGYAEHWDATLVKGDLQNLHFVALLCKRGRVIGVVACDHERATAALAERMKQPLQTHEALMLIKAYDD